MMRPAFQGFFGTRKRSGWRMATYLEVAPSPAAQPADPQETSALRHLLNCHHSRKRTLTTQRRTSAFRPAANDLVRRIADD